MTNTPVIIICYFLILSGCRENITVDIIKDREIPDATIEKYLQKAKLNVISKGVDSFELRKWSYFQGEFPLLLERYYLEDVQFKGECYLFSSTDHASIGNVKQVEDAIVKKITFDLPRKLYDSLLEKYDLRTITNYPSDPDSSTRLTSATRTNILVEHATPDTYKIIYVENPLMAYGIGPEFTKLQSFTRFTYDSLLCHDSLRKEIVLEWMNMIYSNDHKNGINKIRK